VVLDGTLAIQGPWAPVHTNPQGGAVTATTSNGTASGHYAADAGGHSFLQLFVDGEMQVLAREPNAKWSDKSIFYGVANWFRSASPGVHNLKTGEGLLRDNGACEDRSECCARCNTHDLAKSGINATGALAARDKHLLPPGT
jgi:hypothetical protein